MAYGDINYQWLYSGSVVASANTAHGLFGTYNGMSNLNANEVLHVQIQASGADLMLYPNVSASAYQDGQWMKQDIDVYLDIPPMRVRDASQLHFRNLTADDNAVARWVCWAKK